MFLVILTAEFGNRLAIAFCAHRTDLDPRPPRSHSVNKLCIFAGTMLGGYGGWYLGDALGLGMLGAYLVSGVGSVVGVWLGWKLARKLGE